MVHSVSKLGTLLTFANTVSQLMLQPRREFWFGGKDGSGIIQRLAVLVLIQRILGVYISVVGTCITGFSNDSVQL